MSVRAGRRPPNGGLRRKPRGDRAADQMALNGLLIRADNSGRAYKAILARVAGRVAPEHALPVAGSGPSTPNLSYSASLRALSELELGPRTAALREAAVRYAYQCLATALWASQRHPGAAHRLIRAAVGVSGRRLIVAGNGTWDVTRVGRHRERSSA